MTRPEDQAPPPSDTPVTVIGGYLGSGKTTLVNHILRAGGGRIAVLVNDFGDVEIDAALIDSDDGTTISLANGCICCSLVDGLANALDSLLALSPRPDRIVVETSGVADPATVAAYAHAPGLLLDAVVVLVDAETIRQRALDRYVGDTVTGQLASGDIVVLNKVDLVTGDEVAAVRGWLAERCPGAVVVEASDARVDPALLFGAVEQPRVAPGRPGTADLARDRALHHRADEIYQSWSWRHDGTVPRSTIDALMDDLPDTVVRAKGVLRLAEEPGRAVVLQRVGRRWSVRPLRSGDDGPSRLVVIGHRNAIDQRWLDDRLTG